MRKEIRILRNTVGKRKGRLRGGRRGWEKNKTKRRRRRKRRKRRDEELWESEKGDEWEEEFEEVEEGEMGSGKEEKGDAEHNLNEGEHEKVWSRKKWEKEYIKSK